MGTPWPWHPPFQHVSITLEHFLPGMTRSSRHILCFPYPRPGITYFSKELVLFSEEWVFRSQGLGAGHSHYYRMLGLLGLLNVLSCAICVCIHIHTHRHLYLVLHVYLVLYVEN